jgi:hypothetical protein
MTADRIARELWWMHHFPVDIIPPWFSMLTQYITLGDDGCSSQTSHHIDMIIINEEFCVTY